MKFKKVNTSIVIRWTSAAQGSSWVCNDEKAYKNWVKRAGGASPLVWFVAEVMENWSKERTDEGPNPVDGQVRR